jgi:hypothetical protein
MLVLYSFIYFKAVDKINRLYVDTLETSFRFIVSFDFSSIKFIYSNKL